MSKIDEKKIKNLIHSLGLKYNLSDDVIKQIVESQFEFIGQELRKLDLSEVQTEEEFSKVKTNFMITALGRLYIPFANVDRMNKQKENLKNYNELKWKK